MARSLKLAMAGDGHHVTAHGQAMRLAERVAGDSMLSKAMTEMMKRTADVDA